jgi:hypothetical protein
MLILVVIVFFTSACEEISDTTSKSLSEHAATHAEEIFHEFERGYPSANTASNIYDASDLRRAIVAYKAFVPTLATEAVIQQMISHGARPNEVGMVMATSPRQQFQAANSDTPYALLTLDLESAGPMVIEMPANPLLLGIVNDHNMKWVVDLGGIGPEKGEGGKHLILPQDYEGDIPEGYYVSKSPTGKLVVLIRTVPLDGDVSKAIEAARKVKVYPLSNTSETSGHYFIDVSDQRVPLPLLDWEGEFEFWRQLHAVIDAETALPEYRHLLGMLAELGIEKGKSFNPDPRTKRILVEAAATAHAEMSVSSYANRRPERVAWEDRQWEWIPLGQLNAATGDFGTAGVNDIDASNHYFFLGWGTSTAIGRREVGRGALYYTGYKDQGGEYFDGGKNYKLTIPSPIPAQLFWSVTLYDTQTRCLIESDLGRSAVRSHLDGPQANSDGSYDLYFGPKAPEGKENNWVQTNSGSGWFVVTRLYSPQQPVFDGSWKLNDIVEID